MICEKCGKPLRFFRRDVVVTEYNTDEDGDQQDWVEEEFGDEREKWYKCGCKECPYVPNRTLNAPGIVAQLKEA